jgi:hypothetical protein
MPSLSRAASAGPPVCFEPTGDLAHGVLAEPYHLKVSVMRISLHVEIPETYISRTASSALLVIRLQHSKSSITSAPS